MYVRFITYQLDPQCQHPLGIFQGGDEIVEAGLIAGADLERLEELFAWFNRCLMIPTRLSRPARPHWQNRAVCWFKPHATRYIRKAREIVAILERNGAYTAMLTSKTPGYVTYEDNYQIAAVPFRDEARRVSKR